MKIRLSELPPEGETFQFDDKSSSFRDLLGKEFGSQPFTVVLSILPTSGRLFQLSGHIKMAIEEVCSKCGDEFHLPVELKVNEYLMIGKAAERSESYAKVNNFSELEDSRPDVFEVQHDTLDLAELSYELISVAYPNQPTCGESEGCRQYGDQLVEFNEEFTDEQENNPFHSLKGLLKN